MTESYYNHLAPYYKLIYLDWDKSLHRQAEMLNSVIREFAGQNPKTVLDVACGVGTQSIGLATLGYQVTASDLSSGEIEQARQEALSHGVQIEFQTADMCKAWEIHQKQFDVVIACDNSVPHLNNDDEILLAFRGFFKCTKDGGCCIITVRDYAQFERIGKRKQMVPRLSHPTDKGQILMFDVWDFDDDHYEITTYLVDDIGALSAQTQIFRGGKYYCVDIPTSEELFKQAGFQEVHTLRDRFFQPLIIALK